MAKGYWVSVYPTISDPERLTAYDKLAGPAVQAGGGRVCPAGGRSSPTRPESRTRRPDRVRQLRTGRRGIRERGLPEGAGRLPDGVERDFRIIEGID